MIWKPHATVAAITEKNGKFLIVEENVEGEIVYNQPAGHLDPKETLIDAVIRETREETAWRFHPEALVGIYLWEQPNTDRTFLRFAFCGKCDDHHEDQTLDDGILRALWMSKEELLQSNRLRSPMVIKNIDDYVAGKRLPLDTLTNVSFDK